MNKAEWMAWQKQVIKEEYNDLTYAKGRAEKSFNKVVKESLLKVRKHGN